MVEVSDIVFTRNEEGKLIPQEVELELLEDKPKVKVVPLTRGKLQEIYAAATSEDLQVKINADQDVIKFGLVEPKLTDEQLKDVKPKWALALTTAILSVSLNVEQSDVKNQTDSLIESQEADLKKK